MDDIHAQHCAQNVQIAPLQNGAMQSAKCKVQSSNNMSAVGRQTFLFANLDVLG